MELFEKMNRVSLDDALRSAGGTIKGNAVVCPFHDDHKPSGSIYQKQDGSWSYYCHGCGWKGDVYDVRQILNGEKLHPSPGKPTNSKGPN